MVVMIHPRYINAKFALQAGFAAGAALAILIAFAFIVWFYLQLACNILVTVCAYANQADMITRVLLFMVLSIGIYVFGKKCAHMVRSLFSLAK